MNHGWVEFDVDSYWRPFDQLFPDTGSEVAHKPGSEGSR